jgi:hypothetical protein
MKDILDKVVDEFLKKRIEVSMGVEAKTPEQVSAENIRNVLRRVVSEMRNHTSLWDYVLMTLFGTDNEQQITKHHAHSHHHTESTPVAETEDTSTEMEEAEEKKQLLLDVQTLKHMSEHLEELLEMNKNAEHYLAHEWNMEKELEKKETSEQSVLSQSLSLLINIPADAQAHENQVNQFVKKIEEEKIITPDVIISMGSQIVPKYAREIHHEDKHEAQNKEIRADYSKLVKELHDLAMGTKLIFHPGAGVSEKEMEAMIERNIKSFAAVAALHGAHTIYQVVPGFSRSGKELSQVFVELMRVHRIPEMYQRAKIPGAILGSFEDLKQKQSPAINAALDSVADVITPTAANEENLTARLR